MSLLGLVLLAAATALLGAAAAGTTVRLRPDSGEDAAVTFGTVAAAGTIAAVLACGIAGLLEPLPVLAVVALWALAVRKSIPRPRRPRARAATVRRYPWEAALTALAVAALGWQLLVAVVLEPYAYDAITYHLSILAGWLQEGNLAPSELSICCAYYPANAELLFAWPVLFTGHDALVDTVQIPFVALGAAAVAGIARTAGLPRRAGIAAGALFAVTPIVLVQAPTNYADVLTTACVLAALHALARFAATAQPRRLVVAGLATGIVLGTKGTGVVWGLALIATGTALAVAHVRGARRARPGGGAGTASAHRAASRAATARGALAALSLCVLLGGYFYARNWVETGNPAYPFAVAVAGVEVFDGPFTVDGVLTRPDAARERPWPVEVVRSWAHDVTFWRRGAYDYQQRSGGLGPLWPWLGLPLALPLAIVLARRRSPASVVLLAAGVVLLVQPYRWWSRFTIVLAAVGALAIAAAVAWAPRAWMRAAVRGAGLALAVVGVALSTFELDPAGRAEELPAGELLALIGTPAHERSVGQVFHHEYEFVASLPARALVVADLRAPAVRFVYPLFGPRHERTVLPAQGRPPDGAWVVTGVGRPLDHDLASDPRFTPAFERRGLRVWRPAR